MALSERILMGPGPCNPYPDAVAALSRPMLGHLDPEFLTILDETNERLRQVWQTSNRLTFPVSATGSAGMEICLVNVIEQGDPVVIGVNGVFGARMVEVAERCGAAVTRIDFEWGQPVDPDRLLAAHPSPKVVGVVHAETSTGVRSEIAELGANKGEALLLVDCVTSLGGIPVEIDEWGVDLAYSGTQKCLGVAPGLAPVTVSDRAREFIVDRPRSWYLDLNLISKYVDGEGARAYHHTAPISMVFSLHAGLGVILEEGLEAAWARHEACGQRLREGLIDLGFDLFAAEGYRLPELTTVKVPEGVDEAAVRSQLLTEYGIEIGGGLGEYTGKVWRIGCMGHTAQLRNVELLLAALARLV